MNEEKQVIGWCVIPPYIMARADLSPNEKLVYGRILGLSDKEGYCYASNEWLGLQIGLKGRTVRAVIAKLKEKQLIDVEVDLKLVSQRRIYPQGEASVKKEPFVVLGEGVMNMTPQDGMDMTPSETVSSETFNSSSKEDGQARGMKKLGSVLKGLNLRVEAKPNPDKRLSNGWQYYALEVVKVAGFVNGGRARIFQVFRAKNYGHFQMEKAKALVKHPNFLALKTEDDRVKYLIGAFKNG